MGKMWAIPCDLQGFIGIPQRNSHVINGISPLIDGVIDDFRGYKYKKIAGVHDRSPGQATIMTPRLTLPTRGSL